MGLISYTNMEDGDSATANSFNERFGQIVDEVNGNLDANNLATGAVTTAKIAAGAVTASKITLGRTVDANGWTVTDFGGVKIYTQSWNCTPSIAIASHARASYGQKSLPVGNTLASLSIFASWHGNYNGHALVGTVDGTGDTIVPYLGNTYTGTLNFTGKVNIVAFEIS